MRYVSKMHRRLVRQAILGFLPAFPFSLVGVWALYRFYMIKMFGGTPNDISPEMLNPVLMMVFTLMLPLPFIGMCWIIIQYTPGFSTIEVTDTHLRIRNLLKVRLMPRKSVKYFGLRQKGMWLVRHVPSLASLPQFEDDGCPPLGQVLSLEYNESDNVKTLKRIVLPIIYTEAEIQHISTWVTEGARNAGCQP